MRARHEEPRESHGTELRARDIDRLWAMARLDEAFTDGQLTADEHLDRLAAARSAVTVRELDVSLHDLQLPVVQPRRGVDRARTAIVAAALLAAIAIVAGSFVWTSERGNDRPAATVLSPETDRLVGGPVFAAAGLDEVVRAIRAKFGTTVIEGVHFYRDKAVVSIPEAVSPTGSARYTYSLGGAFHEREVYGGLAVSSDPNLRVDVAKLDTRRLAALIAAAPEQLRLTSGTLPRTVPFRVTVGGDDGGQVWVGVNSNGLDSHLVAGLDGKILGVHRCRWGC